MIRLRLAEWIFAYWYVIAGAVAFVVLALFVSVEKSGGEE